MERAGQLGVRLAGKVMKKGLFWLCFEEFSLRVTDTGRPEVKLTVQSAAWSVWPVVELCVLTVSSPTLRNAWKAERNIALRRAVVYGSWDMTGIAAMSLCRILRVIGRRASGC